MFAEFIYQPLSGQYDEIAFDLTTQWKSNGWAWVKFISDNEQLWVASFRGEPLKIAIAEKTKQATILTEDGIYFIDIEKRKLIFSESQTQIQDIIHTPTKDRFIIATYGDIGFITKDFKFHILKNDHHIDYIKFHQYDENRLIINFETRTDYKKRVGYIDTDSWTIINEEVIIPLKSVSFSKKWFHYFLGLVKIK